MFVLPSACAKFGRQLPQVGTKIMFKVVTDSKTGQPRAEACSPVVTAIDDNGAGSQSATTEATFGNLAKNDVAETL